jgi:hypothetical protein
MTRFIAQTAACVLFLGVVFVVLALALAYTAREAFAAPPQCATRALVLDTLATKYGETRRAMGIAADQTVMEVFASEATGSWTLTVTLPTGMTCLVAAGQNYEAVTEELPAQGIPG